MSRQYDVYWACPAGERPVPPCALLQLPESPKVDRPFAVVTGNPMRRLLAGLLTVCLSAGTSAAAAPVPAAIFTDPPHEVAHPARSVVLHIPVGGVNVNGLAYIPAGMGPHPTLVLLHGLPGNEKNLDLAQAVRRAGWTVVTFNYRGSWGSPGRFSFEGNLEDARAVLAYVRDPAEAARLQVDTRRLVLAGHSMGGWVTALIAARDPGLLGVALISAADMAAAGRQPRDALLKLAGDNRETLAGVTDEDMADQMAGLAPSLSFPAAAPGLARRRLLVLSADDGLAAGTDRLVEQVRAHGGLHVTAVHVATDHSWSDARIRLETEVVSWLESLPASPDQTRSAE